MVDIPSYLVSTIRPTLVGPEEKIRNKDSQMAGKRYFENGFQKFRKETLY